jgi:hypothetical protein
MLPLGRCLKIISDWFNTSPYQKARNVARKRGRPKKARLWQG